MGKVFTITEGLENMGALKTGGQGSVYKGRRIGEVITAVKLLPTPIYSESNDDKNFTDFQNEVEKLKKVNEHPNPNVVKILSSGITETGNFPFIEMEFIEGSDLEELLKPPYDSIFTVKESIKVAEQLANALAHCHRVDVKHGDIKSNNVKFNIHSGNYVLIDFGLAIMSDEQRRTSLRHAGAIEFMAPEQSEGIMLFPSDVYSFGIILFELLAGSVPFPLKDKGETARNVVMVSHLEAPVPDLLSLRNQNMPPGWSAEKKDREIQVPQWLLNMIYKCLEKKPEARFKHGMELYEYIILNSTLTANKNESSAVHMSFLQEENEKLLAEKDQLQKLLLQYQDTSGDRDNELELLRNSIASKDEEINTLKQENADYSPYYQRQRGVSKAAFFSLLFLTGMLGAFAAYSIFFKESPSRTASSQEDTLTTSNHQSYSDTFRQSSSTNQPLKNNNRVVDTSPSNTGVREQKKDEREEERKKQTDPMTFDTADAGNDEVQDSSPENTAQQQNKKVKQYRVVAERAYFHNEPDRSTRRNAFIVYWNNAVIEALDEKNGFIYVVYTNHLGQISKGWLRKEDLARVDEE
ncbi:MAG: serine/threonine-protein kinase [Chitinophagaceae bacterium]